MFHYFCYQECEKSHLIYLKILFGKGVNELPRQWFSIGLKKKMKKYIFNLSWTVIFFML